MGSEQNCHVQKVLEIVKANAGGTHRRCFGMSTVKTKGFLHVFLSGNNQKYGLFLSGQSFRHERQTLLLQGWRGIDHSQHQDEKGESWAELFRFKISLSHHMERFVQWTVESSIFATTSISFHVSSSEHSPA